MKGKAKMLLPVLMAIVMIGGAFFFTSCEKYAFVVETVNPEDTVHFQTQIQPIFSDKCIGCHGSNRNPDLREGFSYNSLTTGGFVTLPAEASRLYIRITSGGHVAYTNDTQKDLILNWIKQGAKNNK